MEDDQTALYGSAANCSLYEEDPQPDELNVGTLQEPRMVSSSEAWRDFYARQVLVDLEADVARIDAAQQWAAERQPTARESVRGSSVFGKNEWAIAIELCARAMDMIRAVGADTDQFARRRLLAGAQSSLINDTLGSIPGAADTAAEMLVDELDRIDRDERRDPQP